MIPTRKLYFIGLNVVRALSIISLLLVLSSSILAMVTNIRAVNAFEASRLTSSEIFEEEEDCDYIEGSTVPNQAAGVFWAVVASLLIVFQVIALLLSECSWPLAFFDRFFPVLGTNFGLGALGIFQALLSTQILSHHVADDFSLVAAFFLFALGCVNMLLGLIFRASAKERRSIRGWREEQKKGNVLGLPKAANLVVGGLPGYAGQGHGGGYGRYGEEKGAYGYGSDRESVRSTDKPASLGFGRQASEKAGGLRGFMLSAKPEESLPRYVSPPSSHHGHATHSRSSSREHSPVRAPMPLPLHSQPPGLSRNVRDSAASAESWGSGEEEYESRQARLHREIRQHGVAVPRSYAREEEQEGSEDEEERRGMKPAFKSSRTAL